MQMLTPCLTTIKMGALSYLEEHLLDKQFQIEAWFREKWRQTPPLFYASVDLRNAEFKCAPVDTNIFPAGFNNLNKSLMPLAVQAVTATLSKFYPDCQRILIIPENHTRNLHYFENLAVLQEIIQKAGYQTRIGSLLEELEKPKSFKTISEKTILLEPIYKQDNRIQVNGFDPCLLLLNNDFASGIPEIFNDIEQVIFPKINLGWSLRSKTHHFFNYQGIAEAFAKLIDIDPWLITPIYKSCEKVDFMNNEGIDCLVNHAEYVFQEIANKYEFYQIQKKPFIIIKADAGTYGMGVISIESIEQLKTLNRKQRKHMAYSKGNKKITKVLIQEGIYTAESYGEEKSSAEPVVYLIGEHVIGGFYRIHNRKTQTENLNVPGMQLKPLAFSCACNIPDKKIQKCMQNRFYVYGVLARLAMLAAANEITK